MARACSFLLADVVDFPAMLRVGFEPVVGEQVGQVGWLSGLAGGGAGCGEGEFSEEMVQPGPGFDFAEFGAGDDAQQNRGSFAAGFAAHK